MKEEKRILEMNDDVEHGIVVHSILELRNKHIREGRSHEDIDGMLVKAYQAPSKRKSRNLEPER